MLLDLHLSVREHKANEKGEGGNPKRETDVKIECPDSLDNFLENPLYGKDIAWSYIKKSLKVQAGDHIRPALLPNDVSEEERKINVTELVSSFKPSEIVGKGRKSLTTKSTEDIKKKSKVSGQNFLNELVELRKRGETISDAQFAFLSEIKEALESGESDEGGEGDK